MPPVQMQKLQHDYVKNYLNIKYLDLIVVYYTYVHTLQMKLVLHTYIEVHITISDFQCMQNQCDEKLILIRTWTCIYEYDIDLIMQVCLR